MVFLVIQYSKVLGMSEQKLQTKILKWLKAEGCWVFKTVVCNRSGIPDIIGCTTKGRLFAIEVKFGSNKASELQNYNLREVAKCGGIAVLAYNLETVQEAIQNG